MEEVSAELRPIVFRYSEVAQEKMILISFCTHKYSYEGTESVGYFEMVGSHFSLEEVWLADHAVDVETHDGLREHFIVQAPAFRVFLE